MDFRHHVLRKWHKRVPLMSRSLLRECSLQVSQKSYHSSQVFTDWLSCYLLHIFSPVLQATLHLQSFTQIDPSFIFICCCASICLWKRVFMTSTRSRRWRKAQSTVPLWMVQLQMSWIFFFNHLLLAVCFITAGEKCFHPVPTITPLISILLFFISASRIPCIWIFHQLKNSWCFPDFGLGYKLGFFECVFSSLSLSSCNLSWLLVSSLKQPVNLAWHSLKWVVYPPLFGLGQPAPCGMQNAGSLAQPSLSELADHLVLRKVYCSVGPYHFFWWCIIRKRALYSCHFWPSWIWEYLGEDIVGVNSFLLSNCVHSANAYYHSLSKHSESYLANCPFSF